MSAAKNLLFDIVCLAGMLIGLPLLGVSLAGLPLEPYFEFPPQTRLVQHAPFSWTAFCWYSALIAAVTFTVAFPDRFMVGTDTFTPERWYYIEEHARWSRAWLADLPKDLAERIPYKNFEALFAGMKIGPK